MTLGKTVHVYHEKLNATPAEMKKQFFIGNDGIADSKRRADWRKKDVIVHEGKKQYVRGAK